MTRAEKKCLAFSVGMHLLLAVILIGSAAFESTPRQSNMPILNMIPARILDNAGVGGGSPNAAQPPPPQPQPSPQPQTQPQPVLPQPKPAEPVKQADPKPERPEPRPVVRDLPALSPRAETPSPKPARKTHEIQVDYTPYSAATPKRAKPKTDDIATAAAAAAANARAEAKRQRMIKQALASLESGLESRPSDRTIVDLKGEGGEAFADYRTVIYNIYHRAWITPENVANKLAETKTKIIVSRDGTIQSAEIVSPSGETTMDKSVERVLRAVKELPPFPPESHDTQRTFLILFNLEGKEASG